MIDQQKQQMIWKNKVNNAQGHAFESYIKAGCEIYREEQRGEIDKTPEPFRVMKKYQDGTFKGRFTSLAQPDFQGTLNTGQSIVFEAKYTTTDKLEKKVVTEKQKECLDRHERMGALTAVCVGSKDQFYFVPWNVWKNMKEYVGRNYVTQNDLYIYHVTVKGADWFLVDLG